MSTLAKCSVCGHITDDFVRYGSLALTDEYPHECPCICSSECQEIAADKITAGEWKVPKLRLAMGGYAHNISKPREGYDAQPTQESLVKQILENQKP